MNYSVLLPVYYKEKPEYLDLSIKSMILQTVKPFEIIIVKDGRLTAELESVLDKYEKKYKGLIICVALKENSGIGIALNIGLNYCNCELVARMDADDISRPDRCEKQIKQFEKNNKLSVVGTLVDEFIGNVDNVVLKRIVPTDNESIIKFARKRNPINHPSVMFRKRDVIACGGYKPFYCHEDYYLWIRMLSKGMQFYNINESLLLMRIDDTTYKRRGGIKYLKYNIILRYQIYKLGLSSLNNFIISSFLHGVIILLPDRIRKQIYTKLLR